MFWKLWGACALAFCLLVPAVAQERRPERATAVERTAKSTGARAATLSVANSEVFRNITIQPGQSVTVDSTLDYTATDRVSVTFRAASNVDLSVLEIDAYWAVPNADSYSVAEYDSGTNFPYLNVGGTIFNVYGNQFRMLLSNTGKTAITLQQVTVYMRAI
jgi:hypothetical protein